MAITRYVDFNRGSDSNDGASKSSPWKNLSKLNNLSITGGSQILLANDSVWDINPTLAAGNRCYIDSMQGSVGSAVYVGGYDYAGVTGLRPTIKYRYFPVPADWTWDSVLLAWYVQFGFSIENDSIIKIGNVFVPSSNQGGLGINSTLNGVNLNSLRSYIYDSAKRIYLAYDGATQSVTPSDYFGAGEIMMGCASYFNTYYFCPYTTFDGLAVADGGRLFNMLMGDAGRIAMGLEIKNCTATNVTGLAAFNTNGIGSSGIGEINIHNNSLVNIAATGFKTYGQNIIGAIKSNYFADGNLCNSWGGAVYTQSNNTTGTPLIVSDNFALRQKNGVGTNEFDGSAYYSDVNDNGTVFTRNVAKDCFKAMQINSGLTTTMVGNVAIGCDMLVSITDASNVGQANYTFANNTALDIDGSKYGHGINAGGTSPIAAWSTSTGNLIASKIYNNVLVGIGSAAAALPAIFAYRDSEWASGKVSVKNNYVTGFSPVGCKTQDGTNKTTQANFVTGYANFATSDYGIDKSSCLYRAGADVAYGSGTSLGGFNFFSPPSVGAVEVIRRRGFFSRK